MNDKNIRTYTARIYKQCLRWALANTLPEIKIYSLPDPFEPLLVLYERGGWVYQDKGFWVIEEIQMPLSALKKVVKTYPPITLDDKTLNALDDEYGENKER